MEDVKSFDIFQSAKELKVLRDATKAMKNDADKSLTYFGSKVIEEPDSEAMMHWVKLKAIFDALLDGMDSVLDQFQKAIENKEDEIIRGEEVDDA